MRSQVSTNYKTDPIQVVWQSAYKDGTVWRGIRNVDSEKDVKPAIAELEKEALAHKPAEFQSLHFGA